MAPGHATCAVLAAVALAAGAAQRSSAPQLEFGSAVSVVSLPVFVTDAQGRAVAGLTRADFELFDEGRPVKIVGFSEVDAARPELDDELRQAPAARRQFLLLFDLAFTGPAGLVRARQAALEFVARKVQPLDLVSVATFSAHQGLRVLVGFTSDRAQLRRALTHLGLMQVDRPADPLGLVYDLTELGGAFADTTLDDGALDFESQAAAVQLRYQQSERAAYTRRIEALLEALGGLARSLDGLQGRKQVVLLSSGFDATALVGETGEKALESSEALARGQYWAVRPEERYGDASVRANLRESLRAFSTSDAVVHAVDLSGLAASGDPRFAVREPGGAGRIESLAVIADASGGRLFKGRNDPGSALDDVLEMSRHYYLLAIEPGPSKGEGRFHRLKARLRGRGLRASHRSGYFERAQFAARPELARRFEAAEVLVKGVSGGDVEYSVLATPYRPRGDGYTLLPVVLDVDGESLLGGAASSGRFGVEIYGYALTPDGGVADMAALTSNVDLALAGARLRRHGLQCHLTFALAPGRYDLRFLVRDSETGRLGARFLSVAVPAFVPDEMQLAPPIVVHAPGERVMLRAASRSVSEAASAFQIGGHVLAPDARPSLTNGRTSQLLLLAFDRGAASDPGAAFEVRAQLLDADGSAFPEGRLELVQVEAEADGLRRLALNLTPEGVPAGTYTLRVRLRDTASGRLAEAFRSVRLTP